MGKFHDIFPGAEISLFFLPHMENQTDGGFEEMKWIQV